MADYIIGYFGGTKPASPEEGQVHRGKWMKWIEGLGDKVVNPGQPLMNTKLIGPAIDTPMTGFAVVRAGTKEEALAIAKADPFLEMGGTIQVSEMVNMPG
jgi:hypothetical protein